MHDLCWHLIDRYPLACELQPPKPDSASGFSQLVPTLDADHDHQVFEEFLQLAALPTRREKLNQSLRWPWMHVSALAGTYKRQL